MLPALAIAPTPTVMDTTLLLVGEAVALNGLTDIVNFTVANASSGSDALSDFAIQTQMSYGGAWTNYLVKANFAAADNNMLHASTDVSALAANTTCSVSVRTGPIYGIRFYAKGAATITVTILGTIA